MPMNPQIKAQWVADLRSGQYEQGNGYLNADGKLCCLGVLCEQAVKAGVPITAVLGIMPISCSKIFARPKSVRCG